MNALQVNARLLVLTGVAIVLGTWTLSGLLADSAVQSTPSGQTAELLTVGPTLEPELVEVRTFPADLRTVARPGANGAGFRQTAWDDQPTVSKAGQVQMLNHTAVGDSPTSSFGHERPGGAFAQLLDQVFGPDRFA
ncbi:MAG: hypothetical protein AAB263_08055, partial [Planctomycetota bacterium]